RLRSHLRLWVLPIEDRERCRTAAPADKRGARITLPGGKVATTCAGAAAPGIEHRIVCAPGSKEMKLRDCGAGLAGMEPTCAAPGAGDASLAARNISRRPAASAGQRAAFSVLMSISIVAPTARMASTRAAPSTRSKFHLICARLSPGPAPARALARSSEFR